MTTDTDTKLEELENNYQIHRVLESSGSISALVTDVGVNDDQVYVQFELGESTYSLGFHQTVDGYLDLKRLCIHTDVPFQSDLSELIENTVSVEFGYDEYDNPEVYIEGKKAAVTEPKTDWSIPLEYPSTLSEEIVRATNRIWHYNQSDDEYASAVINEVTVEDGRLIMTFDLCGEKIEWGVQVQEDFAAIEDSVYQTVVEEIGQGSLNGIEGSEIYIVWFAELGSQPEYYVDLVDYVEDDLSKWGIFSEQKEANLCRLEKRERTYRMQHIRNEDDFPRELENDDSLKTKIGVYTLIVLMCSFVLFILFALLGWQIGTQIAGLAWIGSFFLFCVLLLYDYIFEEE